MSLAPQPILESQDAPEQPDLPVGMLGPIAIVAPHPDDETLGCGGLIAWCARLGVPVTVIAMTDGEASHPESREITQAQLIDWRAEERRQALAALGAPATCVERLGLPDGGMQTLRSAGLQQSVERLDAILHAREIKTVLVTAADDEHGDHQVSHALVHRALAARADVRRLIYSVWPPSGVVAHGPRWSLNISDLQDIKQRAIECFVSQRGELIRDAPGGFVMPEALVGRALAAAELYYPDRVTIRFDR